MSIHAPAVQAACERAAKEGTRAVVLPAGQYGFEASVRVPGGLTVVGEGAMPHDMQVTGNAFLGPFETGVPRAAGEPKLPAKYYGVSCIMVRP